jgi:hypothetical protein
MGGADIAGEAQECHVLVAEIIASPVGWEGGCIVIATVAVVDRKAGM